MEQQVDPLRVFINDANTFLGHAIIEEIRNDHMAFGCEDGAIL